MVNENELIVESKNTDKPCDGCIYSSNEEGDITCHRGECGAKWGEQYTETTLEELKAM